MSELDEQFAMIDRALDETLRPFAQVMDLRQMTAALAKRIAVLEAERDELKAKLEAMSTFVVIASEVKADWLSKMSVAQLERGWPAMKRLADVLAAAQQEKE